LLALYEFGALEEAERASFLDHLAECDYCYEQVYETQPVATAFQRHRASAQRLAPEISPRADSHARLNVLRSWLGGPIQSAVGRPALAGALMVLVCTGMFFVVYRIENTKRESPPSELKSQESAASRSNWEALVVPKASYGPPGAKPILRQPGSAFDRAMKAYTENRFEEAIQQLKTVTELEPNAPAEVKFYLGVSLLLSGRFNEAVQPLRQAEQLSDGRQRESCSYYLLLGYLKGGQLELARMEVDKLTQMNGEHRALAESLRNQLTGSPTDR
jgi:tetratricopeptide (TPR) repeat protein